MIVPYFLPIETLLPGRKKGRRKGEREGREGSELTNLGKRMKLTRELRKTQDWQDPPPKSYVQ